MISIEFYKDRKGEHRWRARAKNGKIVAEGGEGYKWPSGARKAVMGLITKLQFDQYRVKP